MLLAKGVPLLCLFERSQRRAQRMFGIIVRLSGVQAVEHIDGGVRQHFANVFALPGAGHEESTAASLPQGAGHGCQAKSIGITFDGGPAAGLSRLFGEQSVVGLQRAKVHG